MTYNSPLFLSLYHCTGNPGPHCNRNRRPQRPDPVVPGKFRLHAVFLTQGGRTELGFPRAVSGISCAVSRFSGECSGSISQYSSGISRYRGQILCPKCEHSKQSWVFDPYRPFPSPRERDPIRMLQSMMWLHAAPCRILCYGTHAITQAASTFCFS